VTPVPGGFACLTFQKNVGAFARLSGFCHNSGDRMGHGHRGDGAMTIFDYVAIGALIVLGVFAVTVVSGGRFKL
jgi:hypothetical protein